MAGFVVNAVVISSGEIPNNEIVGLVVGVLTASFAFVGMVWRCHRGQAEDPPPRS
jgi:hypothetical protein